VSRSEDPEFREAEGAADVVERELLRSKWMSILDLSLSSVPSSADKCWLFAAQNPRRRGNGQQWSARDSYKQCWRPTFFVTDAGSQEGCRREDLLAGWSNLARRFAGTLAVRVVCVFVCVCVCVCVGGGGHGKQDIGKQWRCIAFIGAMPTAVEVDLRGDKMVLLDVLRRTVRAQGLPQRSSSDTLCTWEY
jgi:hypothetical protein